MLFQMPPHAVLALIHGHRNDDKLRAIAVLLLRRLHARQQLGTNGAPRRPEFDDHRLLADPLRQSDGISVQILECDRGRRFADWNADDILTPENRWQQEDKSHVRRTTYNARNHHTWPALTK